MAVFSDFCSPAEAACVLEEFKFFSGVNLRFFGGNENCERRCACFFPDYMEISEADFPLAAIEITFNKKFSTEMSHRDYLGSILGLGIDRSKTGDILVFDGSALCYVKKEISDYIASNIEKVGRNSVKAKVVDISDIELPKLKTEEKSFTVASLRIDAVAGGAFNIARGKIQLLIEGEKTFLNFLPEISPSKTVGEGDMISVRGFGRFKILSVNGKTKKDRISITVLKYV